MNQPQSARRKVMGRMDLGTESANATPVSRPRVNKLQQGSYSGSSTPNSRPQTSSGTSGRAKVDLKSFGGSNSSPSTVNSPILSPPLRRAGSSTSSASLPGMARVSALSPTIRAAPVMSDRHTASSPHLTSDGRWEDGENSPYVSIRSHRTRSKNQSIDLSSPSTVSFISAGVVSASASSTPIPQFTRRTVKVGASAHSNPQTPVLGDPNRGTNTRAEEIGEGSILQLSRTPSPSHLISSPPDSFQYAHLKSGRSLAPAYESPKLPFSRDSLSIGHITPQHDSHGPLGKEDALTLNDESKFGWSIIGESQASTAATHHLETLRNSATISVGKGLDRSEIKISEGTGLISKVLSTGGKTDPFPLSYGYGSDDLATDSGLLERGMGSFPPLVSPSSEISGVSLAEAAEAQEAKKNRKLLDLEITNKSLMAINAGLEVTKAKQAKEIRELKRRLREGRGLSLTPAGVTPQFGLGSPAEEDDGEWFEDADEGQEEDPELEAAHMRCKSLIDRMISQARIAILSKHDPGESRGKVLNLAELAQIEQEREAQDETSISQQLEEISQSDRATWRETSLLSNTLEDSKPFGLREQSMEREESANSKTTNDTIANELGAGMELECLSQETDPEASFASSNGIAEKNESLFGDNSSASLPRGRIITATKGLVTDTGDVSID